MKNVFILYAGDDWDREVAYSDKAQRDAYIQFGGLAYKQGMQLMRGSLLWFDSKAQVFTKYWKYQDGDWVKVEETVLPDIVLDKSSMQYELLPTKMEINAACMTVNSWELDLLSTDKLFTQLAFKDWMLPAHLIRSAEGVEKASNRLDSESLIVKPRLGHGGKEIDVIEQVDDFDGEYEYSDLMIAQEMVDTSDGIPGVYDGVHDLRIMFIGSEPQLAFIRTPAPESELCNLSQGGSMIPVSLTEIPEEVWTVVNSMMKRLEIFPRKILSFDFFYVEGTPRLIEMNSKPILYFPQEYKSEQQEMQLAYIEYFKQLLDL